MDDCAQAEWASKLGELSIPEIDRFANPSVPEIVLGDRMTIVGISFHTTHVVTWLGRDCA